MGKISALNVLWLVYDGGWIGSRGSDESMVRTMVAPETARGYIDLFDGIVNGDDEVVVERDGKPVAVLMNPETYARLLGLERTRDWAVIDRVRARNADRDPDEVFADVSAEVDAARREWRGRDERDG